MDKLISLRGNGPAFILIIIEVMMYGGLEVGLPRDLSLKDLYQTVMGSLKLLGESGDHPSVVKERL